MRLELKHLRHRFFFKTKIQSDLVKVYIDNIIKKYHSI